MQKMGSTSPAAAVYTGVDNLENMELAVNYNGFLADLVESLGDRAFPIVDFGAGAGTFALQLRKRGREVQALEPDARLRSILENRGIRAFGSLEEIPNASLPALYSFNVLEHIEDDAGTLGGLNSKLQPGGRLLLYVPAFLFLFSSMDRKVGHLRRYRRRELIRKARAAGFVVKRARYADSLGFFATLLYKLVGNKRGDLNVPALVAYDRYVFPLSRMLDRLTGLFFGKNVYLIAHKE